MSKSGGALRTAATSCTRKERAKPESLRRAARFIGTALAVIVILAASEGLAYAHQDPAGCNGNTLNANLLRDVAEILNGGTVHYRVDIMNNSANGCNVTDTDVVFHCPAADGTPTGASTTLTLTGNFPRDGSGDTCWTWDGSGGCQTNAGLACVITLTTVPGQATARVNVGDINDLTKGALHDSTNDSGFDASKELNVSVVAPTPTPTPTPTSTATPTTTPTNTPPSPSPTPTPTPTPPSGCPTCEGPPVVVDQNVLADFNASPPTCIGDADLCAFFSFDISGATPDTWRAIFDLGARPLIVQSGATITTSQVGAGNNKYAPGIEIRTTCTVTVDAGGAIVVESLNKPAGDILIRADGTVTINGTVSNSVVGTNGLPGDITIATCCGDIITGRGSLIQTLGTDPGGSDINLLTCCEQGDIDLWGLVMARAKAHTGGPRPDVRIASFFGSVTIHGDTVEPQFDEYNYAGTKYDLFPGVLSWVTHSSSPGTVQIQALTNVTVLGHGDDPTPPVRQSFAAVAAGTGTSNATGGDIDVFALTGDITGTNRAFESFGRYNADAVIRLFAGSDVLLSRPGPNSSFNPVVDSGATPFAGQGGTNALRAFLGGISIGANALIDATGNTPGLNLLTSCLGVVNLGTVNPPDANAGDDAGVCAAGPAPLFTGCSDPIFDIDPFLPPDTAKVAALGIRHGVKSSLKR